MAKVYTGKIAIPGDKIDEYFEILKQQEEKRQPFKEYLEQINQDFYDYLTKRYRKKTAIKHSSVI